MYNSGYENWLIAENQNRHSLSPRIWEKRSKQNRRMSFMTIFATSHKTADWRDVM